MSRFKDALRNAPEQSALGVDKLLSDARPDAAVNVPEQSASSADKPSSVKLEGHSHRCSTCGCIWFHPNIMEYDDQQHKCPNPKCTGWSERGQFSGWRKYEGGQPLAVGAIHLARQNFTSSHWKIVAFVFFFIVVAVMWGNILYGTARGE